jgi:hypothetical protein
MENLIFAVTVGIFGLGGLLWMLTRVRSNSRQTVLSPPRPFEAKSYLPMERLLSGSDVEFLRGQPGFRPPMEKRIRSARRAIFRAYLKALQRDFRALHLAVTNLVLAAPVDQSPLLAELFRENRRFQMMVWHAQFGLVLHWMHLGSTSSEVTKLIEAAARLSEIQRALIPAPVAA